MKIRDKNQATRQLIEKMARSEKAVHKAVAKGLNRPRRKGYEVSVYDLEKHTKPKEHIMVPGVVLGNGTISKPITVAALRFSRQAADKISKAGGKCMSIEEMVGSKQSFRIMG